MLSQAGGLRLHPGALPYHTRILTAVTSLPIRSILRSRWPGSSRSRHICQAKKAKQAAATEAPAAPAGDLLLLQIVPSEEEQPGVYLPYDSDRFEIQPRFIDTEELLDGLDGVDVQQQPEAAAAVADVQVCWLSCSSVKSV